MKREETVGFVVKTLNKLIVRNEMAALGMTEHQTIPFSHGWIIGYLYENQDKEIYQKDLEAVFSIARSTVTSIVKQMEKAGYITRVAVDRDSRLKRLKLTEKGTAIHEEVKNSILQLEKQLRTDNTEEELEVFFQVAAKIRKNLCQGVEDTDCWCCAFPDSIKK